MIDLDFEQKQAEAESIARNALGISWWGTESAARRVAEHAAEKTLKYERKIKAADRLAEACESAFDSIDATGPQEFYLALDAYRETQEGD